jgi:acyl-coenzyme A synthetase/AMP-(fatty) acid ligase
MSLSRDLGRVLMAKVPKYVFFVDSYPKTASGKIQKFKLKELGAQLMREGRGLEEQVAGC